MRTRPRNPRKRRPYPVPWQNVVAFAVGTVLVVGFGILMVKGWDQKMNLCLRGYEEARTAADTVEVDGWRFRGKNPANDRTCGHLRRDGTLDRHRAAERRRQRTAGV